MATSVKSPREGKSSAKTLTMQQSQMPIPSDETKIIVEMGWSVKAFTGEVDLDGACLMFNQYCRFEQTIFWDNLSADGIRHLGDEAIVAGDDEEESKEEEGHDEEDKEDVEIDLTKLDKTITTLVFVINIFSNKTFSTVTNISFNVYGGDNKARHLCKFKLQPADLKLLKEKNTLVLAKLFKTNLEKDLWTVQVLKQPENSESLPFGQVVDVLIPKLLHNGIVEPLVPTWSQIKITVIEGRGLAAEDLNGKSDPFVKVYAGPNWKRKTKVKKKSLNPVWTDEEFILEYDKTISDILFEVWDDDLIGKNEFLGHFTVDIPRIPPNKEMDRWFRLVERKKKGEQALGSIHVKLLKSTPNT